MTELEKYELINKCETVEELRLAIISVSGIDGIQGRKRVFDAEKMSSYVSDVVNGNTTPNLLTRSYGIRQQALYLKYYVKQMC